MIEKKINSLLKGYAWSALGALMPLLTAVVVIPHLINSLGIERFGILSLSWLVVGYFGFFDFGMGRAITQLISKKIGERKNNEIAGVIINGVLLMLILGIFGSIILINISKWLVEYKLSIPQILQRETLTVFYYLAMSIPIVITSTAFKGVLEAFQRFDMVNIIRIPLGVATYLGPLLVAQYSKSLIDMVIVIILLRVASLIIYFVALCIFYPELFKYHSYDIKIIKQLTSFGGWVTVSNITGPLLLYLGRFVLAGYVSMESVAYFSTPYDAIVNILLIPGVFVGVLLPIFSKHYISHPADAIILYKKTIKQIGIIVFPITIVLFIFAKPLLSWWINLTFAENSYLVAKWIAIGVFINSFGHISQVFIQSCGRPDWTAKLHLVELIIYLPYMWWLIEKYGIEGAAIAWTIRVTISTIALFYLTQLCILNINSLKNDRKIRSN